MGWIGWGRVAFAQTTGRHHPRARSSGCERAAVVVRVREAPPPRSSGLFTKCRAPRVDHGRGGRGGSRSSRRGTTRVGGGGRRRRTPGGWWGGRGGQPPSLSYEGGGLHARPLSVYPPFEGGSACETSVCLSPFRRGVCIRDLCLSTPLSTPLPGLDRLGRNPERCIPARQAFSRKPRR